MLLELIDISKRYDVPEEVNGHYVLKNLNLKIDSGEAISIIGPSGSGKSTLLNIIGALDRPTNGQVLLNVRDLSKLSDRELAEVRNQQIGFIFQLHHLLPQYTVMENVLVPTLANRERSSRGEKEAKAEQLLKRVGLEHRLTYRPGRLSGGERQRVAVVRALINSPKILLADEPTGSLDRVAADALIQLLTELNREENVTLILVTHSMTLAGRMTRVLELKDGMLELQRPQK